MKQQLSHLGYRKISFAGAERNLDCSQNVELLHR